MYYERIYFFLSLTFFEYGYKKIRNKKNKMEVKIMETTIEVKKRNKKENEVYNSI